MLEPSRYIYIANGSGGPSCVVAACLGRWLDLRPFQPCGMGLLLTGLFVQMIFNTKLVVIKLYKIAIKPRYRQILYFFAHGYSVREIAQILNVDPFVIYQAIKRSKRKLNIPTAGLLIKFVQFLER